MSVFETNERESYEAEQLGELFESSEFGEVHESEQHENEMHEFAGEYEGEQEGEEFLGALGNVVGGLFGEVGEVLNEQQELELTSELLEIQSEEELEEFLGKLFKGVAKGVGGFIRSPIGKALGGALKSVAKTALPIAAGALGNLVVPGLGGMVGSKLGSMAGNLFEVPVGEMGEQEAEFEVARRYVRLATTAARHAATAPAQASPQAVARAAVLTAARRHAPGLAQVLASSGRLRGRDGRFVSSGMPRRSMPSGQVRRTRQAGSPTASTVFAAGRRTPAYAGYSDTPYARTPSYAPSYGYSGNQWYGGSGGQAPASAGYAAGADGDGCRCGRKQQGRWYRRGSRIVLAGI